MDTAKKRNDQSPNGAKASKRKKVSILKILLRGDRKKKTNKSGAPKRPITTTTRLSNENHHGHAKTSQSNLLVNRGERKELVQSTARRLPEQPSEGAGLVEEANDSSKSKDSTKSVTAF